MKSNELYLCPMTPSQFDHFRNYSCEMYAKVSPHYRDLPFEKAFETIRNDFDSRFAPQGVATTGQYFIAIMNYDEQVGYFHFGEFPKGSTAVFGWNFHIFEKDQRLGFGKRSAQLAKSFLKEKGYRKIALNVRADNETAIKIYEAFGFKLTQLSMEADL